MVRLQRVIFTALHQYLGLSSELVQHVRINNSQLMFLYKSILLNIEAFDIPNILSI